MTLDPILYPGPRNFHSVGVCGYTRCWLQEGASQRRLQIHDVFTCRLISKLSATVVASRATGLWERIITTRRTTVSYCTAYKLWGFYQWGRVYQVQWIGSVSQRVLINVFNSSTSSSLLPNLFGSAIRIVQWSGLLTWTVMDGWSFNNRISSRFNSLLRFSCTQHHAMN